MANALRRSTRRHALGFFFLEETLAAHPVWAAFERENAIVDIRSKLGKYRGVVFREVQLGVALLGPEDFVGVRNGDGKFGHGRLGHFDIFLSGGLWLLPFRRQPLSLCCDGVLRWRRLFWFVPRITCRSLLNVAATVACNFGKKFIADDGTRFLDGDVFRRGVLITMFDEQP